MNGIKYGLIFSIGAAAGAGVSWFVMNKKLKQELAYREEKIQEAVDQVKAAYDTSKKNAEMKKEATFKATTSPAIITKEDLTEYEKLTEPYQIDNVFENQKDPIEVISTEEAEDLSEEDYTEICLTYFPNEDVVLYDTSTPATIMEDPEDYLGKDFRQELYDSDEDPVFIKNDLEGAVYIIYQDTENSIDDVMTQIVEEDIVASDEGGD